MSVITIQNGRLAFFDTVLADPSIVDETDVWLETGYTDIWYTPGSSHNVAVSVGLYQTGQDQAEYDNDVELGLTEWTGDINYQSLMSYSRDYQDKEDYWGDNRNSGTPSQFDRLAIKVP